MRTTKFLGALVAVLVLTGLTTAQCNAPGTEDFDSLPTSSTSYGILNLATLPAGWAHDTTTATNSWRVDVGGTSSGNTGPSVDHTTGTSTGVYLYTETSGGSAGVEAIMTVCFDATGVVSPTVEFWYHMFGAAMGTLEVWQSTDTGTTYTVPLFSKSGDQGNQWLWSDSLSVTPDAGTNEVYLQIKGIRGTSFTSDMAIDDWKFGEPTPIDWEVNDAIASLDIDGVQADPFNPAIVNLQALLCSPPAPATGTVNLSTSGNPGAFHEVVFSDANLQSFTVTGLLLGGSEIVNLSIVSTLSYLNGGGGIVLAPMPLAGFPGSSGNASVSAAFSLSTATDVSMQGVITDAASILGYELTQGSELHVSVSGPAPSVPGPTTDDGFVTINLLAAPSCWLTTGITFYGTVYTDLVVNANGRAMFTGGDTDFSASPGEFLTDNPSVGAWTDLSPNAGGSVTVSEAAAGVVRIDWAGVPYFGQAPLGNSFGIEFDTNNGSISIDGLTGLNADPSENMLIGTSPGGAGGATDPGATTFSSGGSGNVVLATDAWYDFLDLSTLPPSPAYPASLAPGTLSQILFSDDLAGNYSWNGL